jgi:hypothetical protein
MELILKRRFLKPNYTIGKLTISDLFNCDTLEDTTRDIDRDGVNEIKVWGKTSIPFGKYEIDITYSPKFKRQMPILLNVNGFTGVRIHSGNTPLDTQGCILVGINNQIGRVNNSTEKYNELFDLLTLAKSKGEKITIEII